MAEKVLCPWCGAEMYPTASAKVPQIEWCACYICPDCPCVNSPEVEGFKTAEEALEAAKAAALRRYTPPLKPMTLEEVKEVKAVWIEDPEQEYESKLYPAIYWGVGNGSYSVFVADIDDGEERAWYRNEEYGTWWRCWSRKPTDEERSAAGWEK